MTFMYCRLCGNAIGEDATFCSHCGQKLTSEYTQPTNKLVGSKSFIALLWWTLIVIILGILICDDWEDALILIPIYFGVILLVYTVMYNQKTKENKSANLREEDIEYTLSEFADKYGKMQICKYQDPEGVLHHKCIFTRSTDVGFSPETGELTAKEIVDNKSILIIRKIPYSDAYVIRCKKGCKVIKHKPSITPPPLSKISDDIHL